MNFYLPGIQPAKESKQTIIWWCCLFKKPTYSWLQHHYPPHHSSLIILADVGPSIPVKMLVPLFGITLLQLGFHWCFCINLSRSCANTFYKEYCNTMGDTFYEFETLFFCNKLRVTNPGNLLLLCYISRFWKIWFCEFDHFFLLPPAATHSPNEWST